MIHKFRFRENPKCIFCGAAIGFADGVDICRKHAKAFWDLPWFMRWLLPKFIIKAIVLADAEDPKEQGHSFTQYKGGAK